MSPKLPAETLRRLLSYDAETGKLFWKPRCAGMFGRPVREGYEQTWNAKHAGREAFASVGRQGYCRGKIFAFDYRAHRVIWAMARDEWPEEIDHINHNRRDNRLSNLRAVVRGENQRNLPRYKNTSSFLGVRQTPEGRFIARINTGGRGLHLGTFATIEEAAAARKSAERHFGFHENHGRPAPASEAV